MNRQIELTAKIEPFDSFWEAPEDMESGYEKFYQFYKHNYLPHIPKDKSINILNISCGSGYFVNMLNREGYQNVLGIDSFEEKVAIAKKRGLNCEVQEAFPFLQQHENTYDVIFCEQEVNHLTKAEIVDFLLLAKKSLKENGVLLTHALNGANPIVGSEALAQNFDHYNTFTEYTFRQVLEYTGFRNIKVLPLNLYVFWKNPINYILIALDRLYSLFFRFSFIMYGKSNKIWTKKIGAVCSK